MSTWRCFERIRKTSNPEDYILKTRAIEALGLSEKWFTKTSKIKDQLLPLIENKLNPLLRSAQELVELKYREYLSAFETLRRLYIFGIVNDLVKKFSEYRNEHNVILLADTPRLLSEFIGSDDTPFIYEKAGNKFRHILIDEFQDTSFLQWKNLLPLIVNSLGSGNMTLVVGDAKQSIYRWRGGDVNLLVKNIHHELRQFGPIFQEEVLTTNFRSRKDIVEFNNSLFHLIQQVAEQGIELNGHPLLGMAYGTGLNQLVSEKNNSNGFVGIHFLETNSEEDKVVETLWQEESMKQTLEKIRELLSRGYAYRDIAILVRRNVEGNEIANYLFENGISVIHLKLRARYFWNWLFYGDEFSHVLTPKLKVWNLKIPGKSSRATPNPVLCRASI